MQTSAEHHPECNPEAYLGRDKWKVNETRPTDSAVLTVLTHDYHVIYLINIHDLP